jgi:hypothetical protein
LTHVAEQRTLHTPCIAWPLLAIACQRLGEKDEAERWLQKSVWWQQAIDRLAPTDLTRAMNPSTCFANDWLMSRVFHLEAVAELKTSPAQLESPPAPED